MAMEPQTYVAVASAAISVAALFVTWRLWRETNCPIVTAEIRTHESRETGRTYELVVHNCGNRPAMNIGLTALRQHKDAAIAPSAPSVFREEVYRCFAAEHKIPLLLPNQSTRNGFGITTNDGDNALIYGAKIPIEIVYKDIHGRSYSWPWTLIVKDTDFFAGSGWGAPETRQRQ